MAQPRILVLCGIFLAAALPFSPGLAVQAEPPGWHAANPHVLVLVDSTGQGREQVNVQFAGQVAPDEVRRLVAQAGRHGGWEPGPQKVVQGTFVSGKLWEQLTGEKAKPQPRTIASFAVTGLVNRQAGLLRVQEFLQALRDYSPVRVVYKVGGEFQFAGPRADELAGWSAELHHSGQTYTYDLARKRTPGNAPQQPQHRERGPGKRGSRVWAWLCIAAAAVAAGAGAWCWLGREVGKNRRRGDTSGS